MPANVALLNKVMEHIEAHPEEHDQRYWGIVTACGTKFCFAGHTAMMCGHDPVFDPMGFFVGCRDHRGGSQRVDDVARSELGISTRDASRLFFESTTIQQLRAVVDEIASGDS